jgi:tetratricopeptide (TPR) repeat protein
VLTLLGIVLAEKGDVEGAFAVFRRADQELQAGKRRGDYWSLTELGALRCRAAKPAQAVPLLRQNLNADGKPGRAVLNWLWLALAEQRLGKSEEARAWLKRADAWLTEQGGSLKIGAERTSGLDLHNWLEAHVQLREAYRLLKGGGQPEWAGPAAIKSPAPGHAARITRRAASLRRAITETQAAYEQAVRRAAGDDPAEARRGWQRPGLIPSGA